MNPQVSKIAGELSQICSTATQAAAMAAGNGDKLAAIYTAAMGAIGSLQILASLLGHHGDKGRMEVKDEDIPRLLNRESILLAAILANTMAPELASTELVEHKDGRAVAFSVEFGPETMWNAVQTTERIVGRSIDNGNVNPAMLESMRRVIAGSDEPMNRFLAQRRGTPGNLH